MLDRLSRLGDRIARESRERFEAEGCLPGSARRISVQGTTGWLYPVTTEQGDSYQLFLWFDGSAYQVKIASPEVSPGADAEACHVFPDGQLCLGAEHDGGMPTLEGAFSRSVLWATGFSAWRRTGRFPF